MAEYRSASLVDAELDGMNFRGYAAVFDSPWNQHLTATAGYVETVARGAFRKALADPNHRTVPLTWQHDPNQVLATTKSGNLKLREDAKGLLVEAKLPNTTLGRDVREMIDRGDVRGMSYGMQTTRADSQFTRRDGVMYRNVQNVRSILDVTLTWEPSYDETTVELRNVSGFVALPLQEIAGGPEEQPDDAAAEDPPPIVTSPYLGRMADIIIRELEQGGGIPL